MDGDLLTSLVRLEIWVFAIGLTGLVAYQILTGVINLDRLYSDGRGRLSPGRLQLLMVTLAAALAYVVQAGEVAASGQLPAIPEELLLIFGGSASVYLGGKTAPTATSTLVRILSRTSSSERGDR